MPHSEPTLEKYIDLAAQAAAEKVKNEIFAQVAQMFDQHSQKLSSSVREAIELHKGTCSLRQRSRLIPAVLTTLAIVISSLITGFVTYHSQREIPVNNLKQISP